MTLRRFPNCAAGLIDEKRQTRTAKISNNFILFLLRMTASLRKFVAMTRTLTVTVPWCIHQAASRYLRIAVC